MYSKSHIDHTSQLTGVGGGEEEPDLICPNTKHE